MLQLIAEGHSTKEIAFRLELSVKTVETHQIAFRLELSVKTVETHRAQLMERLQIHDIAGLVRYAIRSGLISAAK